MFKFHETNKYSMPAHFGGEGNNHDARQALVYHDCTTVNVSYVTDEKMLSRYIPEGFEMQSPVLSVSFVSSHGIDWMGGGWYNLVDVSVPVKYVGNSEGLVGSYALVIWENKTEPILGGREGCGMPKIFGDIEELRYLNGVYSTNVSYYGRTFLDIQVSNLKKATDEEVAARNEHPNFNCFGWRYIPNVGRMKGAAVSHATVYPQKAVVSELWKGGEGKVQWTKLLPTQHPTQAHIIAQLADMPILQYVNASMHKNTLYLMPGDVRQLP